MKHPIRTLLLILFSIAAVLPVARNTEWHALTPAVKRASGGAFVRLSEGDVHYEIAGPENGRVVVLIHGFSVPMYVWDSAFADLARSGFRVVRFDLYGRGLSWRPRGAYGRDRFVTQVHELVQRLDLRRPVAVAGVSMGGAIATAYAASYPDEVSSVVLIDPLNRASDVTPMNVPLLGEYLNRVWFVPSLASIQGGDFVHPERLAGWPERFREQTRYRGFAYAILSTLRNYVNRDPISDYEALGLQKKPVLLIWGAADKTFPLAQSARVRAAIPGAQFLVVPDAGHFSMAERPELVNPSIVSFLRGKKETLSPKPARRR